jgi:hypothetical protein
MLYFCAIDAFVPPSVITDFAHITVETIREQRVALAAH